MTDNSSRTRDRTNMTPTARAFMERVDRYRKRHPAITEEDAILKVRANPSIGRLIRSSRPAAPTAMAASVVAEPRQPVPPRPKPVKHPIMFRPVRWLGSWQPNRYISHLLTELGRLGMDIHDFKRQSGMITDLLDCMGDWRNEAILYDWQRLNLELLQKRQGDRQYTRIKPRIDIHAYLTSRDNFSVVWYPTGWQQSYWGDRRREMCDFLFFSDDEPSFGRPANELMFIHGVTNLRPDDDSYEFLRYNKSVLDEILICAVRAAYESLIERLKNTFEVTVKNVFVFEEEDHRVLKWSLENAEELQRNKDQAELAAVHATYGFTIDVFREHLDLASQPVKGETDHPRSYQITERLARRLTKAGHKMTPTRVEHLRDLLSRCEH